jgi:hypothetical protein
MPHLESGRKPKFIEMKNEVPYDYMFHFNPHDQLWYAFRREDANAYWSDRDSVKSLLKAKDVKTIMGFLKKEDK